MSNVQALAWERTDTVTTHKWRGRLFFFCTICHYLQAYAFMLLTSISLLHKCNGVGYSIIRSEATRCTRNVQFVYAIRWGLLFKCTAAFGDHHHPSSPHPAAVFVVADDGSQIMFLARIISTHQWTNRSRLSRQLAIQSVSQPAVSNGGL